MSVRFRSVRQFENSVSSLLPTECQKYSTRCGALPNKTRSENHICLALDKPQQIRIIRRIVFQVCVLNNYVLPRRLADGAVQSRSFTHISGLKKHAQTRIRGLQLGQNLPGPINRTIVHT